MICEGHLSERNLSSPRLLDFHPTSTVHALAPRRTAVDTSTLYEATMYQEESSNSLARTSFSRTNIFSRSDIDFAKLDVRFPFLTELRIRMISFISFSISLSSPSSLHHLHHPRAPLLAPQLPRHFLPRDPLEYLPQNALLHCHLASRPHSASACSACAFDCFVCLADR